MSTGCHVPMPTPKCECICHQSMNNITYLLCKYRTNFQQITNDNCYYLLENFTEIIGELELQIRKVKVVAKELYEFKS
jgi:hypothetical protein